MNCVYCNFEFHPMGQFTSAYTCTFCTAYHVFSPSKKLLSVTVGTMIDNIDYHICLYANNYCVVWCGDEKTVEFPGLYWVFPQNIKEIVPKLLKLKAFS